MAEYWYSNGQSRSSLGMVGYDGSNRFNVVYSFTVPSGGASVVTLYLSGIGTLKGSNNTIGVKIGTSPSQYASAGGGTSPDGTGGLSFGSTWGGTINIPVNLPAGTYYATVYTYSNSYGYWANWVADAADIGTSGSYTPPAPTSASISSITANVMTLGNVVINMSNPANRTLYAKFFYGSTELARSANFTSSLTFTCPRSWFTNNISITSMSVTARVYYADNTQCDYRSFTLSIDAGMKPVIPASAYTATKINLGSIDEFIASLTRIQIDFDVSEIDMSNTAGAEVRSVWIEYNGLQITEHATGYPYRFITGAIVGSGYVRLKAQDSRGVIGYSDFTFAAYSYVPPSLSEAQVVRCESTLPYTESQTGTCFKVKLNTVCSDIGGENSSVTHVYYKETSSISYVTDRDIEKGEEGLWVIRASTYQSPYTGLLDSSKTYTVKLVVQDLAGGSKEYTFELAFEEWMLCYTADGDGCGIGQAPGTSHVLQIPSTWEFLSGGSRFGNERIVLVYGKHYGEDPPEDVIDDPIEGQIYFQLDTT